MVEWEYKFVIWSPDYSTGVFRSPNEYNEEYLNKMGAEGWELCSLVAHKYGVFNFFFKRPLKLEEKCPTT